MPISFFLTRVQILDIIEYLSSCSYPQRLCLVINLFRYMFGSFLKRLLFGLFLASSFCWWKFCHSSYATLVSFQLKSTFMELKQNNRNSCDFEIAAAEMRRSELLDAKENLDRNLVSNYQIKAQLQKQLHNILMTQTQERRKLSQLACQMEIKQQTSDRSG